MKTTIYELLGMIKNGKAPKKIKYDGCNYFLNKYEKDYERTDINDYLFDNSIATDILNDEVEILETTLNTKNMNVTANKIEKLDIILDEHFTNDELQAYIYETQVKINEIIDVLNNNK